MAFSVCRISTLRIMPTMAVLLLLSASPAYAQSIDVRFPTGVDGNEIVGAIAARDIGDARLTDHFFTFNGLPGDLLITVQSKNLNGDFDVFTAAELRPLLKVTVYAESSTPITKNIYLRKRESLILRVEARSPNDDEGSYRIRFSGTFEPGNNGQAADSARPAEESSGQLSRTNGRKTTRVSSVGARIEEPVTEVAVTPTAEPTPSTTPEESTSSAKKTAVRRVLGRRSTARRTPTKPPAPDANKSAPASNTEGTGATPAAEAAKIENATSEPNKALAEESKANPEASANEKKSSPIRRASARSSRAPARPAKSESPPESGPRLVIEEKNGTRIEWLMSQVKSVTVQNGQLLVVRNDGHIERFPMTNVVRMSIGP